MAFHFMGREVTGRWKGRTKAIKWEVAKLLRDMQENEWSRSYSVTTQHPNLLWNSVTHAFLDLKLVSSGISVRTLALHEVGTSIWQAFWVMQNWLTTSEQQSTAHERKNNSR